MFSQPIVRPLNVVCWHQSLDQVFCNFSRGSGGSCLIKRYIATIFVVWEFLILASRAFFLCVKKNKVGASLSSSICIGTILVVIRLFLCLGSFFFGFSLRGAWAIHWGSPRLHPSFQNRHMQLCTWSPVHLCFTRSTRVGRPGFRIGGRRDAPVPGQGPVVVPHGGTARSRFGTGGPRWDVCVVRCHRKGSCSWRDAAHETPVS